MKPLAMLSLANITDGPERAKQDKIWMSPAAVIRISSAS
jgi:hypothetical protein